MRKSFKIVGLLIIVISLIVGTAFEKESPPEGFEWKELTNINASFLIPDGWYYSSDADDSKRVHYITKEDRTVNEDALFVTGFTITAYPRIMNGKAKKAMIDRKKNLVKNYRTLYVSKLIRWDGGQFQEYDVKYYYFSKA